MSDATKTADPILGLWARHPDVESDTYVHINTRVEDDYYAQHYDADGPVEQAFDDVESSFGQLEALIYYATQADCRDRCGGRTFRELTG